MKRSALIGALLANGVLLAAVSVHHDADRAGQVVLENEKVALTFTLPDMVYYLMVVVQLER